MATLYQVKLEKPGPQISVSYPAGFQGKSPERLREKLFFVNQAPMMLTLEEFELVQSQLTKSGLGQRIIKTGMVLVDSKDPLNCCSEAELQTLEQQLNLNPVPGQLRWSRVVAIREAQAIK